LHTHEHEHRHEDEESEESASTGFLPISLALALFITGLFVLGLIPGLSCDPQPAAAHGTAESR
jgi:hypothetical protein